MVELIQYVNPDGSLTGETAEKLAAHTGATRKHLAFSSYVFNDNGQLLVSQRALAKKVWPGVWTNTCCGHPMPGESLEDAITRRLAYELGIQRVTNLTCIVSDYSYETPPFKGITENEFCPVYFARLASTCSPNPLEVEAVKWMTWQEYVAWIAAEPDVFSYWTKEQITLVGPFVTGYIS